MKYWVVATLFYFLTCSCGGNVIVSESANESSTSEGLATMYYGVYLVTMETDSAVYAEALVIKDGKILFAGSKSEAMKAAGDEHQMVDLKNFAFVT